MKQKIKDTLFWCFIGIMIWIILSIIINSIITQRYSSECETVCNPHKMEQTITNYAKINSDSSVEANKFSKFALIPFSALNQKVTECICIKIERKVYENQ